MLRDMVTHTKEDLVRLGVHIPEDYKTKFIAVSFTIAVDSSLLLYTANRTTLKLAVNKTKHRYVTSDWWWIGTDFAYYCRHSLCDSRIFDDNTAKWVLLNYNIFNTFAQIFNTQVDDLYRFYPHFEKCKNEFKEYLK